MFFKSELSIDTPRRLMYKHPILNTLNTVSVFYVNIFNNVRLELVVQVIGYRL